MSRTNTRSIVAFEAVISSPSAAGLVSRTVTFFSIASVLKMVTPKYKLRCTTDESISNVDRTASFGSDSLMSMPRPSSPSDASGCVSRTTEASTCKCEPKHATPAAWLCSTADRVSVMSELVSR